MTALVTEVEELLLLLLIALVPAVLYLSALRKTERYQTEAWGTLIGAFFYGALGATFTAAILEGLVVGLGTAFAQAYPGPETSFLDQNTSLGVFFLVIVVAPFIEEALKAWGVTGASSKFRLIADGPVFGAAVGLGFGFFETFLYGVTAFLVGGVIVGIELIIVRSFSSVLLHGASTSVFGFGWAQRVLTNRRTPAAPFYLAAVLMHAWFNVLASLPALFLFFHYTGALAPYADVLSLALSIVFAFLAIEYARSLIARSDYATDAFVHPKYRSPALRPKPPGARQSR